MVGLILDLETDDKYPNSCNLVEFGMVVFDFNQNRLIACGSFLFLPWDGYTFNDSCEAAEINKINNKMLSKHALLKKDFPIGYLKLREELADFVCAHNGNRFDFKILERYKYKPTRTIIDSYELEHEGSLKNLSALCDWYNVPNFMPHSAIGDCLALCQLLNRKHYIEQIIKKLP